jgi:hypothetical protein
MPRIWLQFWGNLLQIFFRDILKINFKKIKTPKSTMNENLKRGPRKIVILWGKGKTSQRGSVVF